MPPKIGPKRLQRLINEGVDPRTLPTEQQLDFARTMARILLPPASEGRPRRLPRHLRPRCMARRRDGRRCQAKVAWNEDYDCPRNGKCRVHGGASTGPKTLQGRQRIAESNRRRAEVKRQAQAQAAARAEALAQAKTRAAAQVQEQDTAQAQSLAREQVEALATYQRARAYAELVRWAESWKEVERAYRRCLKCGVDPRA